MKSFTWCTKSLKKSYEENSEMQVSRKPFLLPFTVIGYSMALHNVCWRAEEENRVTKMTM